MGVGVQNPSGEEKPGGRTELPEWEWDGKGGGTQIKPAGLAKRLEKEGEEE